MSEKITVLKLKEEITDDKKLCPFINDCCKGGNCMFWITYPHPIKPLSICVIVDIAMNTGRR